MFSRGYSIAIGFFWLAAMGWLVREKILPPLLVGDPPSYRTILAVEEEPPRPIAWEIVLNGRRVGGAKTVTEWLPDSIKQLRCRVKLKELPLAELTPAWITAFVKVVDGRRTQGPAVIAVESEATIDIDPLNRPIAFSSTTRISPPEKDTGRSILSGVELNVTMRGKIDGDRMHVVMHSGEIDYRTEVDLPADALMGDVLSPQTRLPGLRIGQTWTVPIYSPFRPPTAPIEILHATVERKDPIVWHDRIVPALLVVYRGDPGLGLSSNQAARADVGRLPGRRDQAGNVAVIVSADVRAHRSRNCTRRGLHAGLDSPAARTAGRHRRSDGAGSSPGRGRVPMIEFRNVSRNYGRKVAVSGLDLTVPSGEIFAFLGPNGAGKTTSIKMLVGLLRPTSGEVRVCGFDVVSESRQANRRVGYIPDEPYLYDKLTGREFLQFIAGMYGLEGRSAGERISREIARFELDDFVDDLCESYSHGMKQRVALAAAILHDPEVLVLDEPTVGLDPRTIRLVKDLLRQGRGGDDRVHVHAFPLIGRGIGRSAGDRRSRAVALCRLDRPAARPQVASDNSTLEQLFLKFTVGDAGQDAIMSPAAGQGGE